MLEIFKSHHPRRHAKSFKYAFEGIFHALLNEANFRVQVIITIIAVTMGVHYKITTTEWGLLTLTSGLLLTAEMINTAIEEFIDHLIRESSEGAKVIKDVSAGFVFITAMTTLIILILIFYPRII
ncbi:diacylglycerol kinase family protein [bacterium]|nr:diacylglycerol kinase family protein [bacterium]